MLSLPMLWLKKLNFMETAKLEMELMKALDAGEDLEAVSYTHLTLPTMIGV